MAPKRPDIRRRWEIRVLVALPAVWILFAAFEGYLAIQLTLESLGQPASFTPASLDQVRLLVIGIASLTALACGAALAVAVTRPMRELLRKMQHRLRGNATFDLTTASEVQQLSNAFDHVLLSFDKFVSDSHILDGMPVGVLVVDRTDTIVRANTEAQRLFPNRTLVGNPVSELCEPGALTRLSEALDEVRDHGNPVEILPDVPLIRCTNGGEAHHLLTFQPTTVVGEVVIAIRDLMNIGTIRGHIQRVDQLAALGAHVASLAHELAGGLMGIQMLVESLQAETPETAKVHTKLRDEVERALRLLTEIRTFNQASARERTSCDLGRLVTETLWLVDSQFAAERITVRQLIDSSLPPLVLDRDRILQAILNIVTNALEATPAGGTVEVAVERLAGGAEVRVLNTGSFIPPEEQEKIFTLFYTTKRRGTGFGLPMSRRALLDHGGALTVTSSPDRGTEFVLVFPEALTSPAPPLGPVAPPSVTAAEGLEH